MKPENKDNLIVIFLAVISLCAATVTGAELGLIDTVQEQGRDTNNSLNEIRQDVDSLESGQTSLLDKSTFNDEQFAQENTLQSLNRIQGMNGASVDAFNKLIADSTTNEADLASHYPYSMERWRFYSGGNSVESNRVFLQYNNDSRYCHGRFRNGDCPEDVHTIKPGQGESLIFQTAERYRYVVQYVSKSSQAFSVNRSIDNENSYVTLGSVEDGDGYGWNFTNDTHAEIFIERNDEVVSSKIVELETEVTDFSRYAIEFNWYNVGNAKFIQTYTENGEQTNEVLGKLSVDEGRGPTTASLPITFQIHRADGSDPIKLNAGSVGFITLGDVDGIDRTKAAYFEDDVGSTDTWVPVRAFRVDPNRNIVNTQLTELRTLSSSADTTINTAVISFSSQNVEFSGDDSWSLPSEWSSTNNVIQMREDVSSIVNKEGVSVSTAINPGGYQLGKSVLTPTGQQFQKGQSESGLVSTRNLPTRDIGVVMVNMGMTGTIGYTSTWSQEW